MSFRKRNIGISSSSSHFPRGTSSLPVREPKHLQSLGRPSHAPGLRPSPLDGRLTTSTGTSSLDELLAGHGGLALGTSILLEESGTTDYAGILLKYYAAEGLVQGHTLHVVGLGEQWGRELPGLVGGNGEQKTPAPSEDAAEKMKIAWRYERLARSGIEVSGSRGVHCPICPCQQDAKLIDSFRLFFTSLGVLITAISWPIFKLRPRFKLEIIV